MTTNVSSSYLRIFETHVDALHQRLRQKPVAVVHDNSTGWNVDDEGLEFELHLSICCSNVLQRPLGFFQGLQQINGHDKLLNCLRQCLAYSVEEFVCKFIHVNLNWISNGQTEVKKTNNLLCSLFLLIYQVYFALK
jgi:hypothetical protein